MHKAYFPATVMLRKKGKAPIFRCEKHVDRAMFKILSKTHEIVELGNSGRPSVDMLRGKVAEAERREARPRPTVLPNETKRTLTEIRRDFAGWRRPANQNSRLADEIRDRLANRGR